MLKGNKGEWSELYVFCYLLKKGALFSADKDLNPTGWVYNVLRIFRDENANSSFEYVPSNANWTGVKIFQGDRLIKIVDDKEFKNAVDVLYQKIPNGEKVIPELDAFFSSIYVTKLKADSNHKQDITIKIEDARAGNNPICGFSIKSFLGSNPTLVNASTTNFVYAVNNCTPAILENTNAIDTNHKIIDRINYLNEQGCVINPLDEMDSDQFKENLQFIDSRMPEIISHILLISYEQGIKNIKDVIDILKKKNPLGYSNVNMYEYKVKKLLCACALGMTPEKSWEGQEDATGGYIVVKRDGSVVCYHVYNRTEFEQYLFEYTYFDKPSTSRHQYMAIYEEDGIFKIKLNLQVRFK